MVFDLHNYGVSAPEFAPVDPAPDRRKRRIDLAVSAPDDRLCDYVSGYVGFATSAPLPTIQRVLPGVEVSLLLGFDPLPGFLCVDGVRFPVPPLPVAGPHDHAVTVHRAGAPAGVTVLLTPPGAYALLGIALREITNIYADWSPCSESGP